MTYSTDVWDDPVLVRLTRGGAVESQHRGAFVVVGGDGVTLARGDVDRPHFVRSAAKPFQAAAALAAGIAERFGLTPAELAVLCASHNGEDVHVACVQGLLARGGFGVEDLRCGSHAPLVPRVAAACAGRDVSPTPLDNNCSGKHAGMLLLARHLDADPRRYLEPDHPVQLRIRDVLRRICAVPPPGPDVAIDGCSAPTFRIPLRSLAEGFRRLANPEHAAPADRLPLTRLRDAMLAHPELVAGTDRIDTDLMRVADGRVLSKVGAEGILACGVPGRNLGLAIKIADGAARAHEPLMIALLRRLEVLSDDDLSSLARYADPLRRNHAGLAIGGIQLLI